MTIAEIRHERPSGFGADVDYGIEVDLTDGGGVSMSWSLGQQNVYFLYEGNDKQADCNVGLTGDARDLLGELINACQIDDWKERESAVANVGKRVLAYCEETLNLI